MKFVFHLGVHCTDDEQLLRCLLKNRGRLADENISVPGPNRYRPLLRESMNSLRGAPATAETQATILDAVLDSDLTERVIFAHDSFLGVRQRAVSAAGLYPNAGDKLFWMAQLFPDDEITFSLAIRDLATFLPQLADEASAAGFPGLLDGIDPLSLRWSDLLYRMRNSVPDTEFIVWCNEDTPLIWPEVLAAVTGHSEAMVLEETDRILATIMRPEGFERLGQYLGEHPPQSVAQRRRIVTAFLERFAMPEAIEMELDLPGWDQALVDRLSANYMDDVAAISAMDGVTLITQ